MYKMQSLLLILIINIVSAIRVLIKFKIVNAHAKFAENHVSKVFEITNHFRFHFLELLFLQFV